MYVNVCVRAFECVCMLLCTYQIRVQNIASNLPLTTHTHIHAISHIYSAKFKRMEHRRNRRLGAQQAGADRKHSPKAAASSSSQPKSVKYTLTHTQSADSQQQQSKKQLSVDTASATALSPKGGRE
jgi:hypothetical protein